MDDILIFSTQKTHKQDIEDLLDVFMYIPTQMPNVLRPACLHGFTFPD